MAAGTNRWGLIRSKCCQFLWLEMLNRSSDTVQGLRASDFRAQEEGEVSSHLGGGQERGKVDDKIREGSLPGGQTAFPGRLFTLTRD